MTRVYTAGTFDLFHVGHLSALRRAAALGDHLIVGVTRDGDAAKYKRRPVFPYEHRVEIVSQIACVDEVIEEPLYPDREFYRRHRIDVHCQGNEISGFDFYAVPRQLGILRIIGRDPRISTSEIVEKIRSLE